MPWLKLTRKMDGTNSVDLRHPFKSAEDCMDSFDRFERDPSFGFSPCWPVFYPANDEELEAFKNFLKAAEESEKPDPTKELAKNLLGLVKEIAKHIKEA